MATWPFLAQAEEVIVTKVLEGLKNHQGSSGADPYVLLCVVVVLISVVSWLLLRLLAHEKGVNDAAHKTISDLSEKYQQNLLSIGTSHATAIKVVTDSCRIELKDITAEHRRDIDAARFMAHTAANLAATARSAQDLLNSLQSAKDALTDPNLQGPPKA